METQSELIEHYLKMINDVELHRDGDHGWLMRKQDTMLCSTVLIFQFNHIFISGDFSPCRNGVVSCVGYGLEWFTGQLYPGYLAEKFLERKWCPLRAKHHIKWMIEQAREDEESSNSERTAVIRSLNSVIDEYHLHTTVDYDNAIEEHVMAFFGYDTEMVYPRLGYDISEVAQLSAIQQTFRKFYLALEAD